MGYISTSGSSFGSRAPELWIEVDGVRRSDAQIDSVRQSSGLAASTLEMTFPYAFRGDRPIRSLARVVVWLDRHLDARPIFVGRVIRSPQLTFNADGGPRLSYLAADLRWFLQNEPVCLRDYNKPSRLDGTFAETLSSRQIVADLYAQYQAHCSAIPGRTSADLLELSLASFPDVAVGELNVKGQAVGEAMQRLVESLGGGAYRLHVKYNSPSSVVLACFRAGQGLSQRVVIGTDQAANEFSQPDGVANVGSGDEAEDASQVVNEIILESPHNYRERAVALGPAFDPSLLDELTNYMSAAMIAPSSNIANPLHDPKAADFARVYEIPEQIDADGVRRRLKVAPQLFQPRLEDPFWRDREPKPFLVYRFSESDDWKVMFDGFAIQDNRLVVLSRRLIGTIDETTEYDEASLLLDTISVPSGSASLFLVNSIPAGFDLAPYVSGEKEVRDGPGGGGSALTVIPGDPPALSFAPGASVLYVNVSTGLCHLFRATVGAGNLAQIIATSAGPNRTTRRLYFRGANTVGEGETKQAIPSEIYLNAGWISEVPLRAESGKQGSAGVHVVRLSTSDDGAKEVACNWFKLASTGEDIGEFEATEQDWEVDAWTDGGGATVLRDDTALLEAKAVNMAAARANALTSRQYRLPRQPVGYQVGRLLYVNNRQTGANIDEVEYSGFEAGDPVTILKAMGQ